MKSEMTKEEVACYVSALLKNLLAPRSLRGLKFWFFSVDRKVTKCF